ncbi:Asparagine synthetase [Indibacter alkaliphilus LW1]|uniref:asparagine synthase (glutamine-hydrolyzing) n=1 Tax=Indibacter alkaliphilus (strain CCUG 57479 / KCTC 22604 / LW1) TaxID=1189612 RepID=S2DW94_INDAL|nr:asparagine synthase (glutamine-hydrolyzing) [Indibacter alkaliphilus]EOZ96371.1 Asparagine synthetase [Indibacter alkaliphilus LW1]
MCGILGSVNFHLGLKELDLIKHRGPDDFGIETFDVLGDKVILGQRRLSIQDLSPAGHQPMKSQCGEYAIIFNGEIYNHLELRKNLDNYTFIGHSDTETILYHLIENGTSGIKELNGIFALAFLELKNRKLTLFRDPIGIKPLYFNFDNITNSLIFSSEIRPIKSLKGELSISMESLGSLLKLRYNPSPKTLFNEIEKLKPGHMIEFKLGESELVKNQRYFGNTLTKARKISIEKSVQEYGLHFESAVKRQLLSDVPVGILLSGGIDSAMVASIAQKYSNEPLKAFTIGFEGEHSEDEIEDAAETARILGLEHQFRKISFSDFLQIFKKCIEIVEEPLATSSMIPMYFLSELASEYVKVVLTGQGADEPLGGYPRYQSELILDRVPMPFQKLAKNIFGSFNFKNDRISRGIATIGIENEIQRFLTNYQVFNESEIEKLIGVKGINYADSFEYYYKVLGCKSKQHPVERMMALDTRMNLSDDLLNYTDKITMNFALECRVPILDLELVNFIESLDYTKRLGLGKTKIIHKAYADKILPNKIINRKKRDFRSPTSLWFRENPELIKSILLNPNAIFSDFFNLNEVNKLIDQHQNKFPKEKQIFLLLGIYFFLEIHQTKPHKLKSR